MPAKEKAKAVTKLLAEEWKKKSKKDKQEYAKQVAEETEKRRGESERGENVVNMTEEDERMQRITSCPTCKKYFAKETRTAHLNSHKENHGFGKTLENVGKITKTITKEKNPDLRAAYTSLQ